MENQVLSVDQMKELVSLGVDTSNASMCWLGHSDCNSVYPYNSTFKDIFENHKETIPTVLTPTFTLQDILDMFGSYTLYKRNNIWWIELIDENYLISKTIKGESELECAFEMLKWIHINKKQNENEESGIVS